MRQKIYITSDNPGVVNEVKQIVKKDNADNIQHSTHIYLPWLATNELGQAISYPEKTKPYYVVEISAEGSASVRKILPDEMYKEIQLPLGSEEKRCVLIVIENHIGVIEKIVTKKGQDYARVLPYKK